MAAGFDTVNGSLSGRAVDSDCKPFTVFGARKAQQQFHSSSSPLTVSCLGGVADVGSVHVSAREIEGEPPPSSHVSLGIDWEARFDEQCTGKCNDEFMCGVPTAGVETRENRKESQCADPAEDAAAKSRQEYNPSHEGHISRTKERERTKAVCENEKTLRERDAHMHACNSTEASFRHLDARMNECNFRKFDNPKEAWDKWDFMRQAIARPSPFQFSTEQVDSDALDAAHWVLEHSVEQVIAKREEITQQIEKDAEEFLSTGAVAHWMQRADSETKRLCESVNGPMAEVLAAVSDFRDKPSVDMFRDGGDMAGKLSCTGLGTPFEFPEPTSLSALLEGRYESNCALLQSLTPDKNSGELMRQIEADAALGRMIPAMPIEDVDLHNVLLASRFGVEQGTQADGSTKVRAVDNESDNGLNDATAAAEKIHNDTLDMLFVVVRLFFMVSGVCPLLWKADVDSAYRRIPARPDQRDLLWVVLCHAGRIWASRHVALPFGCKSSVYAWDRIGALLCHIGRRVLRIPLFRYVDDFFAVDRPECAEHALQCFARVTRAILGASALQERKMQCGCPLSILGVDISIDERNIYVWPTSEKVSKYIEQIDRILREKKLFSGEASKLAGRLNFAAAFIFSKLGRTMLRAIYAQQYSQLPGGRLSKMLVLALEWFREALSMELCRQVPLATGTVEVIDLFCDARGTPPRVAAVLVEKGKEVCYTDWQPPISVLSKFQTRSDEQIMGLELLAVLLGFVTLRSRLKGKLVRVWEDNKGAEGSLRKGSSRSQDHNLIIHGIWLLAAKSNFGIFVERVPSHENIADDPSREDYALMKELGATWVPPVLHPNLWEPTKWAAWKQAC